MDSQVERLVEKVWDKFLATPPERRFMVGIGGIPGSGKTTLSQIVATALKAKGARLEPSHASYSPDPIAAFVPMDGFHLTRAQLSAMPDPVTAHARRGAEFTFDGTSFHKLIQALREPLPVPPPPAPLETPGRPEDYPRGTVFAPSFDHAVKDPKEADIAVLPSHRIVVFEGNYVALDKEPWSSAARLMDEVWFVDVDFAVARRRLVARHVKAGIAADEAEADKRAVENDLPNGEEIVGKRLPVDEIIVSREDTKWVHE
ncbi:P-loop containing nucleoside triphosphate hydrolase protein [Diaporthe sp. PMI_573]|nr:P-loop containing nucleoside triphosphate hydrolase protein [Diaporthaceae sp. PMI_573]